jgi:hypothetical protein
VPAPAPALAYAGQTAPVRHGDYTYVVDPASGVIHVSADIRVANDSAEGARACYTNFHLKVPLGATGFRALKRNVVEQVEVLPAASGASTTEIQISLVECLDYGRQAALLVTYDVPGGAPRSAAPARVDTGYVAFVAWGAGRPGGSSLTVVAPSSLTLDNLGPGWSSAVNGANTVYTRSAIAEPDTYQVLIAGRDDSGATSEPVDVDGRHFELRGSPGDGEWIDHVRSGLTDAVPALEQAIGRPWPVPGTFVIHEAYTPGGLGATNWPTTGGEAQAGEQLDQRSLLRGLAGAWFGSDSFTDQWLAEGLADVYTDAALQQLGGVPAPELYPPATVAVASIVAEIGTKGMATVLEHVATGTGAYAAGTTADPTADAPIDWKHFLDLAEEVGGSRQASAALQPLFDEATQQLLTQRAAAREAYASLRRHGGEWAAPLGVRQLLDTWSFTEAVALMKKAETVLDLRDTLVTDLEGTDIAVPDDLVAAYESATTDFTEAATAIKERTAVAPLLAIAVRADADTGGTLDWLGLIGSDVDGALASARRAFDSGDLDTVRVKSREAFDAAHSATFEGMKRLVLAIGFLLAAVVVALAIRSFIRRRAAKSAEVGSPA